MAASTLRVTRRPKGSPAPVAQRRSLTAASQLITDPQKQLKSSTFGASRQDWQNEAWEHSENVGELSYYVSWRSNSCSRVKLIASEIDPDTGLPTGCLPTDDDGNLTPEAKKVADIVRSIAGGPLGQAEIIKRTAECLTIPGELWIVVLARPDGTKNAFGEDNTTDKWFAVTREEIKTKTGGGAEIELPDGTKHDFKTGTDIMVRLWNPRPRKAREATSPVKACLEPLREIVRTTAKIKNAAKSRMINNGVLFLPTELSLPGNSQAPIAEDQADVPGAPVPIVTGVPAADALANMLYQNGVAASENENSHAALLPVMATVPGEHLKNILHLKFGNDITDVEIKTRTDAITRLAMGLDVSPERLLGIGSNSNHWSAWQVGDEDVQLHVKPVMDVIVKALNHAIIRAEFIKAGIDPEKYILWYDASGLTADPDLTDEAIKANELGALRNEALLRLLNLGEENGYDLTTIEGCQEFARDAITKDPTLIAQYWAIIAAGTPELEAIDIPQPALPAAPDDETDDDDESGAEKQKEPDTEDEAAAVISSSAELILAERLLVNRALELAGKRRFSVTDRDQKARLRGFAPHDYHRVMGPVRESEIPKLINGWDAALLADDVIKQLGVAAPLRAAVLRAVQRELTRPVVDAEVTV